MSSEVPSVTTQRNSELIQIPDPEAGIDVRSVAKKRDQRVLPSCLESRTASECQPTLVFETVNWSAVLASLQASIVEIFQKKCGKLSMNAMCTRQFLKLKNCYGSEKNVLQ